MKTLLPALMLLLAASTSHSADKSVSEHYLLLYPSSTIEIDLSGRCVRVGNSGDALVYLSLTSPGDFDDALKAAVNAKKLKVTACGGR